MLHWGFIGCGDVVEHKSGKPFWQEGKSDVVAVMCRTLAKAQDFAARYQIAASYNSVEEMLQNPAINAIYIATPPSTHMPYAKLALQAGKAVYVEKPMGDSLAACQEVMQLAEEKNLPLYVAYYRRALPYYNTVKSLLASGEIGVVRKIKVEFPQYMQQEMVEQMIAQLVGEQPAAPNGVAALRTAKVMETILPSDGNKIQG